MPDLFNKNNSVKTTARDVNHIPKSTRIPQPPVLQKPETCGSTNSTRPSQADNTQTVKSLRKVHTQIIPPAQSVSISTHRRTLRARFPRRKRTIRHSLMSSGTEVACQVVVWRAMKEPQACNRCRQRRLPRRPANDGEDNR